MSVLACASSFFTPAPFPLVCVVSSMPMCHHPHPMCCGVCVLCEACHMHCVWWLALSNTLPCCAPSSLLFSFCPSLFHHHHLKTTRVWREEREKGVDGEEREEEEEERSDAKTSGKRGKKRKRDYDTWCSQVVSNPSTNQARRGLTSLIRREVVLSS